uniref:DNA polymerase V n=1 Tax=Anopheles atroparvus TaxID=41427 RepID=A0AAG5CYN4_ANOAO
MKEEPGRKAAGKLLDKTVFGFFNSFVNSDDEARVRGASNLIEFLCKDSVPKQKEKNGTADGTAPKTAEMAYALKRLIRGVGSTSNASRAGFFTGLLGLLNQLKSEEDVRPSVTDLFALVKTELSDSDIKSAGDNAEDDKEKTRFELRVGKVLVCGAIIKAGLLASATDLELQTVLNTLKQGMYKMVTPLVYTFLNELAPQLEAKKFSKLFWPLFEPVLNVPKEQHTIDSTYFLLLLSTGTHQKLVNKKYFERNFGAPKLLHPGAFEHLTGVLFNISTSMGINHPFYDCLLEQLIKAGLLVQFVCEAIVPILEQDEESRPKYRDIIVLRMLISLLGRLEDYSCVPELLHPTVVKFLLQNLKNLPEYSEDVRELHHEACKALMECYPKIQAEEHRLATFRRLTQAPGSILIEKYASCKLLQNLLATLSAASLQPIGAELKVLILDESTNVTNSERSYAAQMLQRLYSLRQFTTDQKDKRDADEQRLEVVRFFLTLGVFYSADGVKVLKSSKQDGAISPELATTLRGLFFHSLDHRHAELTHERDFLLAIVRHVQETLQAHGGVKSLRNPLTEEQMSGWNRMYATVASAEEAGAKKRSAARNGKKLDTVFHILLMHMGLHLFSDPELATSSLVELECVMKRIGGKGKKHRRQSGAGEKQPNGGGAYDEEEPEWIEVVVDLFLNLLSQNSHLLRNVIAHVFPHLSGEITLTAFNQILSVINLKDKTNPLTPGGEGGEGDDEEEEEEEEDEDDEKDAKNNNDDDDEDDDDEEDEDDDDDDDDDEELMGDEEEEENISDKMRLAVQQALGGANPDTDTESVDLDEMDEEQGRKLDAALAEAFRAFRQAKAAKPGKKGPTKVEQQMDTVLTHFRMRVFDLVDAYLKHQPDMIICLELMLYVFEMLPIAIRDESKYGAILTRYKQIFNTLIRIKDFRRDAQDVDAGQLNQLLRDLIEKVAKGAAFPERNTYLLKASQFIVLCSQTLERHGKAAAGQNGSKSSPAATLQVDTIFGDLLADFLTNRNPPIAFNVFQTILRMPWNGNWHLAVRVATGGLKLGSVRGIRRIQALQLVRELLRNRRFVCLDQPVANQSLRTICADAVTPYVAELQVAIGNGDRSIGQNELYELLQLLLEIHRLQPQADAAGAGVEGKGQKSKHHQLLRWEKIGPQLQAMRRFAINSQTMSSYRQLCNRLGLTAIGNGELVKENGDSSPVAPELPSNGTGEKRSKKEKQKKAKHGEESVKLNGHLVNGHANGSDGEVLISDGEEAVEQQTGSQQAGALKRKRTKNEAAEHNGDGAKETKNSKKEKRRRKEERLQSASAGMETIRFVKGCKV